MGPTGNDQQAAGAGTPADPPAAVPGQVVSPGGATSQSSDGVLTISHSDAPAAAPAAPAAPVTPADPAAAATTGTDYDDPAEEDFDPAKPTALDSTPDGDPVVASPPQPVTPEDPAPPSEAGAPGPDTDAPGATPQQ